MKTSKRREGKRMQSEKDDKVNHPSHYGGDVEHEVVKCLHAWGLEEDALLWNACKYIARAGKKGDLLEDLKKAQWYLNLKIQRLETYYDHCGEKYVCLACGFASSMPDVTHQCVGDR
jgi:hypothetical protein